MCMYFQALLTCSVLSFCIFLATTCISARWLLSVYCSGVLAELKAVSPVDCGFTLWWCGLTAALFTTLVSACQTQLVDRERSLWTLNAPKHTHTHVQTGWGIQTNPQQCFGFFCPWSFYRHFSVIDEPVSLEEQRCIRTTINMNIFTLQFKMQLFCSHSAWTLLTSPLNSGHTDDHVNSSDLFSTWWVIIVFNERAKMLISAKSSLTMHFIVF